MDRRSFLAATATTLAAPFVARSKAEAQIEALQAELSEPALYRRNQPSFAAATKELAAAARSLATAEERWLELEMQREAMES